MSDLLTHGKTAEQWCAHFRKLWGTVISPRTLRRKARQLGACVVLDKTVIILPEHIEKLFTVPEKEADLCPSPFTDEMDNGGSRAASTVSMAPDMNEAALRHLQRAASKKRKDGSRSTSRGGQNVISLAAKAR